MADREYAGAANRLLYNPWIPYFAGFMAFTPEIPELYWNVDSAEQRYFLLCQQLHKAICFMDLLADSINSDHEEIERLKEQFQKFMESGFDDYYAAQIEQWVNDNMQGIIEQAIKMAFFGLSDDGYFYAKIPKSWAGIVFDTVMDYSSDEYGCLQLKY